MRHRACGLCSPTSLLATRHRSDAACGTVLALTTVHSAQQCVPAA